MRGTFAIGLFISGCYTSTVVDAGTEAGPDAADDVGVVVPADAGPCFVGEAQRCGPAACSGRDRCQGDMVCSASLGLCLPELTCAFTTSAHASSTNACANGMPCLFAGATQPTSDQQGVCAPVSTCVSDDPMLGPHRCFWGDGTEVNAPVHSGNCVAFADTWSIACGERCSNDVNYDGQCPIASAGGECAGPTNDHGYGICAVAGTLCSGSDPAADWDTCRSVVSGECACMRSSSDAPTTTTPFGWFVSLAGCREYATRFPGAVECVRQP